MAGIFARTSSTLGGDLDVIVSHALQEVSFEELAGIFHGALSAEEVKNAFARSASEPALGPSPFFTGLLLRNLIEATMI